ncbi:hypothetical protein [Kitasatospora sp. NPDC088346]|uniref:hypothetical protein n=1 Tax=Kitasatospora sp. NPDC088346 TaxID=3364073 RepID=UPI00382D4FD8
MSDAVSPSGFTVARRGYAPEQVDRTLDALSVDRDRAWERLSVLGAGLREMENRLAEVVQAAAEAPEPDYGRLSDQAAALMAIADAESLAVRTAAERAAEDARDTAYEAGQDADRAAKEYAGTVRRDADEAARRTEERTRAEGERLRAEADHEARTIRDGGTGDAARTRVEAAEAGERAEGKLAELRRRADEMFAAAEAKADGEDAKISATAERRLREAEQHRETVLADIRRIEGEAQGKADEMIMKARHEAERIRTASEREQRDFTARLDVVQTHLDHIKETLAALTGAAVGAVEAQPALPPAPAAAPAAAAPAPAAAPAAAPLPAPGSEADTAGLPAVPPLPDALPAAETPPWARKAPLDAAEAPAAPAAPASEVETRIVPKIVIIDDGSDYDAGRVIRRG